jgi:hypothetical protein
MNLNTHLLNVHTQLCFTHNKCTMYTMPTLFNSLAGFDTIFHSDTIHPILFSLKYSVGRKNCESRNTLGKEMELYEQFLYQL